MARYIDANLLKGYVNSKGSWLNEWDTLGVLAAIDKHPTADVRPERHGRWIYQEPDDKYSWKPWLCSNCKMLGGKHQTEYCPHCGAKMDGKDSGDNDNL